MCPLENNSCQTDLNIKRNVLKGVRECYFLTDFCFQADRSECHKGAERKDAERAGGKGEGRRERKKTGRKKQGVCNGSPKLLHLDLSHTD